MSSLAELVEYAVSRDGGALERAIFGTADARAIATMLADFVARHLGTGIRAALAYQASSGCVASLELADQSRVVVKAHRPRSALRTAACHEVQRRMRERRMPAPALRATGPLGAGAGTIESWLEGGTMPDGRAAADRHLIAATLHQLTRAVRPDELAQRPGPSWFSAVDRVWPRPHSPIFDFEATSAGAEWIDALAARARAVARAGTQVVGHFDWRVEHLRVDRGRIAAIYDWEAVHVDAEPIMVAAAAHAFTACWDDEHPSPPPTLDEARAFVADYQSARARCFDADELRCLAAAYVYTTAYSARCAHALGPQAGHGSVFLDTLHAHGDGILTRGF